MHKAAAILAASFLTLPIFTPTKIFARSDGQIHRDANGWLKVNDVFTGEKCSIKKGRHVLFYMVDGMLKITALNFNQKQNSECVATYPSAVFYMKK